MIGNKYQKQIKEYLLCSNVLYLVFVALFISLPVFISLINNTNIALKSIGVLDNTGRIVSIFIFYIVYLVMVKGLLDRYGDRLNIVAVFGVVSLIYISFSIYFVFSIKQDLYSDFEVMWNAASHTAFNGMKKFVSMQEIRGFFAYTVFIKLFGNSEMVYKVLNVALGYLSMLLMFGITYKMFSKKAAYFAAACYMVVPEMYMVMLIPSHDLYSLPFTLLFILLFYKFASEDNGLLKGAAYLVGMVVLLIAINLTRATSIFLMAGALGYSLYLLVTKHFSVKRFIFVFAAVFIMVSLVGSVTGGLIQSVSSDYFKLRGKVIRNYSLAAHSNAASGGYYSGFHKFSKKYGRDEYLRLEKDPESFYINMIISDLYYNSDLRIASLINKSKRLMTFGGSSNFYIKSLYETDREKFNFLKQILLVFACVFSFMLMLTVGLEPFRRRIPVAASFIMLAVGFMLGGMILFSETQPRYSFQSYIILIIVVAGLIMKSKKEPEYQVTARSVVSGLVILVFMAGSFILYAKNSDYLFLDMRKLQENMVCSVDGGKTEEPFINDDIWSDVYSQPLALCRNPVQEDSVYSYVSAERDKNEKYKVSLLYSLAANEYQGAKYKHFVVINGEEYPVYAGEPDTNMLFEAENITPDADGRIEVGFRIDALRSYKSSSWRRVSRMDISFLRIYKQKK